MMENARPNRRSIRLPDYDYATAGAYFITICTQQKEYRFGHITNDEMTLNDAGRMISERILAIPAQFPSALIDSYVVMPNHIHFIITLLGYRVDRVGAGHRARPLSDANAAADTPYAKNDAPGVDAPGVDAPDNTPGPISGPVGPNAGGHDGPPLQGIIAWFKASTTNYYIKSVKAGLYPVFDRRLWQRNYYEHIIRTDAAYNLIDEYIRTNPQRWAEDRLR